MSRSLRSSSRSTHVSDAPDHRQLTAAQARNYDWSSLIAKGPTYRRSGDVKGNLLLSLLDQLSWTPRDFLEWFFTCDDDAVKQQAGMYLAGKGSSPLPQILSAIWTRFPVAEPGLITAIDPIVCAVLEREGLAVIKSQELNIQPSDISLSNLLAKLGTGPGSISAVIENRMPWTMRWLLHATSADNVYRRRRKREAAATELAAAHEAGERGDAASAGDEESENIGEEEAEASEFPDEGLSWQAKFPGFSRNPFIAVIFVISVMLFVRNRATNAFPFLLGTLLSTYGASVRIVTILSRIGASVSYDRLDQFRVQVSLDAISRAIEAIGASPLWYFIIDNINLQVRRGMQRVTSQNFMLHATNAVIVFLHSIVPIAALDVATYLGLRGKRIAATPDDIRPTLEDDAHMLVEFESVVRSFLIAYCPGADTWDDRADMKDRVATSVPTITPLDPEPTKTFPVGVVDANEGSYKGLLKAITLLRKRLGLDSATWAEHVHIGAGDYLTSRNIRGVQYLRQFDVDATERAETTLPQSQLFHFAMRATDMIHTEHLGDSALDPGSLSRQKDQLRRTYDVNKVDYANGKALIRHSLIARIMDCVMVLLGFSNWAALKRWKPSYAEICRVAKLFVETYATVAAAERAQEAGDDILAHSIFFIIDALRFCAFESAVSHGDAGRILIILKYWAFDFRGAKCHNYARECVEILLRWQHELTDDLRKMWRASWFVNIWGKPGRFIASDLYLEHLNYYVKIVHLAAGSGLNIDNIIRKGSSCVEALIAIADALSEFVGHNHAHRRHTEKKFAADLELLVWNMQDSKLHRPDEDSGMRTLPVETAAAKKRKTKGPHPPPLAPSAIDSLFNKGYSTWNGQWEQFLTDSTWDPQLGAPPPAQGDRVVTELSAEAVTISGAAVSEDACVGFGGVGGGQEFDTGAAETADD